jgi:hypothetical protein
LRTVAGSTPQQIAAAVHTMMRDPPRRSDRDNTTLPAPQHGQAQLAGFPGNDILTSHELPVIDLVSRA